MPCISFVPSHPPTLHARCHWCQHHIWIPFQALSRPANLHSRFSKVRTPRDLRRRASGPSRNRLDCAQMSSVQGLTEPNLDAALPRATSRHAPPAAHSESLACSKKSCYGGGRGTALQPLGSGRVCFARLLPACKRAHGIEPGRTLHQPGSRTWQSRRRRPGQVGRGRNGTRFFIARPPLPSRSHCLPAPLRLRGLHPSAWSTSLRAAAWHTPSPPPWWTPYPGLLSHPPPLSVALSSPFQPGFNQSNARRAISVPLSVHFPVRSFFTSAPTVPFPSFADFPRPDTVNAKLTRPHSLFSSLPQNPPASILQVSGRRPSEVWVPFCPRYRSSLC
jgi:hypothetical protein